VIHLLTGTKLKSNLPGLLIYHFLLYVPMELFDYTNLRSFIENYYFALSQREQNSHSNEKIQNGE
jgi:hypothetical protein